MKHCFQFAILCAVVCCSWAVGGEKNKPPKLTVINSRGKEVGLKQAKFLSGTQTIAWLKTPIDCIQFRESNSTMFKDGITTLVPITAVRKIDYDIAKKIVRLTAALPGEKQRVLIGTTRFVGLNKILIQGDVDLGEFGTGTFKYLGGDAKGLQGIRFGKATPLEPSKGRMATIVGNDKHKTKHVITDPSPLYFVGGKTWKTLPLLAFQKTVRVQLNQLKSFRLVPPQIKKQASADYDLTMLDGKGFTLTLISEPELEKGNKGYLAGIVGRVDVGYRLFPLHTIAFFEWQKD